MSKANTKEYTMNEGNETLTNGSDNRGKDFVAQTQPLKELWYLTPRNFSHSNSRQKGLGDIDNIEVLGSKLEDVRQVF